MFAVRTPGHGNTSDYTVEHLRPLTCAVDRAEAQCWTSCGRHVIFDQIQMDCLWRLAYHEVFRSAADRICQRDRVPIGVTVSLCVRRRGGDRVEVAENVGLEVLGELGEAARREHQPAATCRRRSLAEEQHAQGTSMGWRRARLRQPVRHRHWAALGWWQP